MYNNVSILTIIIEVGINDIIKKKEQRKNRKLNVK